MCVVFCKYKPSRLAGRGGGTARGVYNWNRAIPVRDVVVVRGGGSICRRDPSVTPVADRWMMEHTCADIASRRRRMTFVFLPRPAESFGSPNPIRQFCYTFGLGGGRCCTRRSVYWESLHTVVNLYTLSFGRRRGRLGSFLIRNVNWPPPTGAPFPIFLLLLFPENVGTRRRWWPAPKEKKNILIRVVLDWHTVVGHSNGLLPPFYFSEEGKAIDVAADALDECVAKRPPVVMLVLFNIFRLHFSIFYIFHFFILPPPPSFLFLHFSLGV